MNWLRKVSKFIQNQSGAAMIWAIVVFLVVTVSASTIFMIQHADIKEVVVLEGRYAAYYISLGGMELGLAALMNTGADGKTLFEKYQKGEVTPSAPEQLLYIHEYKEAGAVVGKAVVKVYMRELSKKNWVVVESIGYDGNVELDNKGNVKDPAAIQGKQVFTNYMRINADDPYEVRRDGDKLPVDK